MTNWREDENFEEGVCIEERGVLCPASCYNDRIRITIDEDFSKFRQQSLRKGKWTSEEEAYANKVISLFNRGLLPIEVGTTLRSYLSEQLHCDPMRITKKFAGASCIGKQVFQPREVSADLEENLREESNDLLRLEKIFINRVGVVGPFPLAPASSNDSLISSMSTSTDEGPSSLAPHSSPTPHHTERGELLTKEGTGMPRSTSSSSMTSEEGIDHRTTDDSSAASFDASSFRHDNHLDTTILLPRTASERSVSWGSNVTTTEAEDRRSSPTTLSARGRAGRRSQVYGSSKRSVQLRNQLKRAASVPDLSLMKGGPLRGILRQRSNPDLVHNNHLHVNQSSAGSPSSYSVSFFDDSFSSSWERPAAISRCRSDGDDEGTPYHWEQQEFKRKPRSKSLNEINMAATDDDIFAGNLLMNFYSSKIEEAFVFSPPKWVAAVGTDNSKEIGFHPRKKLASSSPTNSPTTSSMVPFVNAAEGAAPLSPLLPVVPEYQSSIMDRSLYHGFKELSVHGHMHEEEKEKAEEHGRAITRSAFDPAAASAALKLPLPQSPPQPQSQSQPRPLYSAFPIPTSAFPFTPHSVAGPSGGYYAHHQHQQQHQHQHHFPNSNPSAYFRHAPSTPSTNAAPYSAYPHPHHPYAQFPPRHSLPAVPHFIGPSVIVASYHQAPGYHTVSPVLMGRPLPFDQPISPLRSSAGSAALSFPHPFQSASASTSAYASGSASGSGSCYSLSQYPANKQIHQADPHGLSGGSWAKRPPVTHIYPPHPHQYPFVSGSGSVDSASSGSVSGSGSGSGSGSEYYEVTSHMGIWTNDDSAAPSEA